jgi:hypothetical protein
MSVHNGNCEVFVDCAKCNAFISNWTYHNKAYFCINCIDEVTE